MFFAKTLLLFLLKAKCEVLKTTYLVPEDTTVAANRYINIHSFSSLGEQNTPVTHEFYDAYANITGFVWTDLDLDLGEIGGPSFFNPPPYSYRAPS